MAYSEGSQFTAPFYVACLFQEDDDSGDLQHQQRLTAQTKRDNPTSASHSISPTVSSSPPMPDYNRTLLYETVRHQFLDSSILIRQFDDHPRNANAVWPEATYLASFLSSSPATLHSLLHNRSVLELGSATGALAIYLRLHGIMITSSDLDDPIVTSNIAYNCDMNGVVNDHVVHNWGDVAGLEREVRERRGGRWWDVVIASDVLAYEASYEQLCDTVCALVPEEEQDADDQGTRGWDADEAAGRRVMWMCWKRREQKGKERENRWFSLMRGKGFDCSQMGQGIWRIQRKTSRKTSIDHTT